MRITHIVFLLFLDCLALGFQKPPPVEPESGIHFPKLPSAPTPPSPKPDPTAIPRLTADVLYIIDSSDELQIFASPEGLVDVIDARKSLNIKDGCPVVFARAFFIDDPNKRKTVSYENKSVFSIEVSADAPKDKVSRCYLIAIRLANGKIAEVIRKTIDVDNGVGPRPPPGPPVSISISPQTATLSPGGTQQFMAQVIVNGVVSSAATWSTSGGTVANGLYTAPAAPGSYTVTATSILDPTKAATTTVTVASTPVPPPNPPPITVTGLTVLIVFDAETEKSLPPQQLAVIRGKPMRDYLNSKCQLGPDGKMHEWRIFPDGVDASNAGKVWDAAAKRKRDSLPWIVILNRTKWTEQPLPKSVDEVKALVDKYVE